MNPKSPVQVIKTEKAFNLPVKMARCEHVCEVEFHRLQLDIVGDEEVLPAGVLVLYQPESGLFSWEFYCYADEEGRERRNKNWKDDPLKMRNFYLHNEHRFIYLSESRMALFVASWRTLAIRESSAMSLY